MHFVIFGSNSYVANAIVPILLSRGHKITSVGRSHHKLIEERFSFEELHLIGVSSSSLILYLILDYSNIRSPSKFQIDNIKLLERVLVSPFSGPRFVVLGSDSAKELSKSSYGLFKYHQSVRIRELGLSEIKIGWLEDFSTRPNMTGKILKLVGFFPINSLPRFKTKEIHRTQPLSLVRELEKLGSLNKPIYANLYDEKISIHSFVYGDKRTLEIAFVRSSSRLLLHILYRMRYILPIGIARAIDSARSLL